MKFTDRHNGIIIANDGLTDQPWVNSFTPRIDTGWYSKQENGSSTADGWDTLSIPFYTKFADDLTLEYARSVFPIGAKLGARQFWVQDVGSPVCKGAGFWESVVQFKGLAGAQPVVVSYGSSGSQQSVEPAIINGVEHKKVSVHQNTPTATAKYIQMSPPLGKTASVGTSQIPPSAPAAPPNFWATLEDPVFNYPNGWVLMGSEVTPLAGVPTVGLVVDNYQYIQAYTPG